MVLVDEIRNRCIADKTVGGGQAGGMELGMQAEGSARRLCLQLCGSNITLILPGA